MEQTEQMEQMDQMTQRVENEDGEENVFAVCHAPSQLKGDPNRQTTTRRQATAVFTLFSLEDEEYPVL